MSEIHGRGMLADLLRQAGVFALPRDTVAAKAAGRRVSAISTWFDGLGGTHSTSG